MLKDWIMTAINFILRPFWTFAPTPMQVTNEPLLDMPLMGFGTFIGIEADRIQDADERKKTTTDSIFNALAGGCRHLDLARGYGNLDAVSDALKKAFKPKAAGGLGLMREDVWLTMKADGPFTEENFDKLLKIVGVQYFDLFLIHHSTSNLFESENSLEQGWRSLANIDKTKLRRIGVSNFYEPHLSRLLEICKRESLVTPFANEIEMNLLAKNSALMNYCNEHDIKVIAYSPLGYGMSGYLLDNPELNELAKKIDATPAQTALAWMMAKGIAVIPKTRHQTRLNENVKSVDFIEAVKKKRKAAATLDAVADIDENGLCGTAIDSNNHGKSLTWCVAIEKAKLKPTKKEQPVSKKAKKELQKNGNKKKHN